jgi:ribosome maturation protein SDO1
VAASYANQAINLLKRKTKILKEGWLNNGNLVATIEIPAGIQEELENDLNQITKGDVDIKILNKK